MEAAGIDLVQIFNLLVNGGGTAILLFLVIDMRREAREDRAQLWSLLKFMLEQDFPGVHVPELPSKRKRL